MRRVSIQLTPPALLLLGFLLLGPAAEAQDHVVQAMRDELQRSMGQLQLEKMDKPYFVSYTVEDLRMTQVAASFGSLLNSDESYQRYFEVEVRVGSPDLDNSNFAASDAPPGFFRRFHSRTRLPIGDDYAEIRRQLWLATDIAYKQAVENLAKKRAVLQSRTRSEELPDFSSEQPTMIQDATTPTTIDRAQVEVLVRNLSSRFREMPGIHDSDVQFLASVSRTRYLNSEGSSFERTLPLVNITAKAAPQAADGSPLQDFVAAYGRGLNDLPPAKELSAAIDRMGARLAVSHQAAPLDLYNGPVLFEGQAAAELLGQVLLPALLAVRQPVQEDAGMAGFRPGGGGGSLADKLGSLVLPRFLSVTDDPTQTEFHGAILAGSYRVDDEGVATRPTGLIERGVLKTLLADRAPVTGVPHSTGNRRGGSIMPSNVIVTTAEPLSHESIVKEMLRLVQERGNEYGVVIRRMGNPYYKDPDDGPRTFFFPGGNDESRVEAPIEAYKVYPDGREEPIRNLRISGISPASFKDIVAATNEASVYTAPFSPGQFGGPPPSFMLRAGMALHAVSWVVPSLLFEDLTLKKPSGEVPRPPIAPHPFFDREGGR